MLRRISFILLLLFSLVTQAITYAPNGTTGLTLAYNGNVDDTFFTVNLPWSVSFLGTNYNSVYVGSNGYITFQTGNSTYSGFSASNPSGPHISIYPADRRLYKLYYAQIDAGTAQARFVIRVEGVDYSNSAVTHIYEVHFYPGTTYFDIFFVDAPSSGNAGTSGISNGYSYVSTYTTTELTSIRVNTDGTLNVSAPAYSSGITNAQAIRKNAAATARQSQSGNEIQIEQIGDNNTITIRQGVTISGKNRIELYSNGDNNTLNLNQGYTSNGTIVSGDGNNHYQYLNLTGNSNNVTTTQSGNNHFMENTISGNNNILNYTQNNNGSKTLFSNVNGNTNTVNATQSGTGTHYLDLKLTGNGHSVTTNQSGTGNHAATIDLTNSGGAANLNLNQSGATNQVYSIQQSCTNATGCSTTVSQ